MPLSEHEQRLLEQIERGLYADDPKFVASVRTADPRRASARGLLLSAVLAVAGLAALLVGVIVPQIVVGVLGFLVMLVAVLRAIPHGRRLLGRPDPVPSAPAPPRRRRSDYPRPVAADGTAGPVRRTASSAARPAGRRSLGSWLARLDERFQRRMDGPDPY